MSKKAWIIIGIVVLVIVLAGGTVAWGVRDFHVKAAAQEAQTAAKFHEAIDNLQPASEVPPYTWNIQDTGRESDAGAPLTSVALFADGTMHDLGTFEGSCKEIDGTSWTLLKDEKSGVICFFAGGGEEIGVFSEKGKIVVKQGEVAEGDEDIPGTRTGFKTLLALQK